VEDGPETKRKLIEELPGGPKPRDLEEAGREAAAAGAAGEGAADREGLLFRDLIPDGKGGVEHDVTFDAAMGTVFKFTKPDRSADAVEFELGTPRMGLAMPLDYLDRVAIPNA
jgi:hypothetical protein